MWVYKGEDLRSRLKLDHRISFWLDYWLLLHSSETPTMWRARPLGLRSIVQAALNSLDRGSLHLRRAVADELQRFLMLTYSVHFKPSPPRCDFLDSQGHWTVEWRSWFEDVLASYSAEKVLTELAFALDRAIAEYDTPRIMFLTRRIAGELGEDEWHIDFLHRAALNSLRDGALAVKGIGSIVKTLMEDEILSKDYKYYEVIFQLSPFLSSGSRRSAFHKGTVPLVAGAFDSQDLISGVSVAVSEVHSAQAMNQALTIVCTLIERLRLNHHVQTGLHGGIEVRTLGEEGGVQWYLLPRPFWKPGLSRRVVPALPPGLGTLLRHPQPERFVDSARTDGLRAVGKWRAARGHLNTAFAVWGENSHEAAAQAWQAVESISPKRRSAFLAVEEVVDGYLLETSKASLEECAVRINNQITEFKAIGQKSDWQFWYSQNQSIGQWAHRVLNDQSQGHYRKWTNPAAWRLPFDHRSGVIDTNLSQYKYPKSIAWVSGRARADIALAYQMRNELVHTGNKIFSRRMAEYLGRLLSEVCIHRVTQEYTNARIPPARMSPRDEPEGDGGEAGGDRTRDSRDL